MSTLIYKICSRSEWQVAEQTQQFDGSEVDHRDGFIHFSAANQVRDTARLHFAGQGATPQDALVLVSVSTDELGSSLRWESSRGGLLFPHLYGPLPLSAVLRVDPLPLASDGQHRFPENVPGGHKESAD